MMMIGDDDHGEDDDDDYHYAKNNNTNHLFRTRSIGNPHYDTLHATVVQFPYLLH